MKLCVSCNLEKELTTDNFYFRKDSGKWRPKCKICILSDQYKKRLNKRFAKNEQKAKYIASIIEKKCCSCGTVKHIDDFGFLKSNKDGRRDMCIVCFKTQMKEKDKKRYNINILKNREKAKERSVNYRLYNKDKINQSRKDNYYKYKLIMYEYREANKEQLDIKRRKYKKDKYHNDPVYRLRHNISVSIKNTLKTNKNGSICDYIPNTIAELHCHLEALFSHPDNLTSDGKVWMNWSNHGSYNKKTWNDNDPLTWTWQIDHIIPQSDLPYDSMTDPNFQRCWALENLRPLSAKQNCIDGATKIRHKK